MPLTMDPPPLPDAVEIFLSRVEFILPPGYERFMRSSNGAEGFLNNSYLVLWPIEDLFTNNEGYRVEEYAPGFFIIGSVARQFLKLSRQHSCMQSERKISFLRSFSDFLRSPAAPLHGVAGGARH